MDELSCSRCKRFVKNEKVMIEADGKTIVCEKCLVDSKPAMGKHGKLN